MTLSVAIATPHSIWTLADRQLTADGDIQSTDSCKIVAFDATDGVGLLCYAGAEMVGETDPSDWAASIFTELDTDVRGHMVALAEAAATAFSPAMKSTEPGHLFVATCVAEGEPVIYSLTADGSGKLSLKSHKKSYAFMLAGSGGAALLGAKDAQAEDARELLDWIKKAESGEAHPREVTDRLAKWNGEAQDVAEDMGTRAIVAYRLTEDGDKAPGRSYYDGTVLQPPDVPLHHMSHGMDMNKVFELMKRQAMGASLTMRETAQILAYKRRMKESE